MTVRLSGTATSFRNNLRKLMADAQVSRLPIAACGQCEKR